MELGLTGRRAAVAAASGGLGLATARALVAEGASVAICGSDRGRIEKAAAELGPGVVPLVADLTSPDECEAFVTRAQEALGGVDILVANSPGPPPGDFGSTSPHAYQQALELNLLSGVRMAYAAVPGMRERGWGRIVAITSVSVRQPIPNLILSTTARTGLTGFLKSLATEVAADGVTVNTVQPGLHSTPRVTAVYDDLDDAAATIPARRLGSPDDFGAVITFLCSEQANYVTGTSIPIDGGHYAGLQ